MSRPSDLELMQFADGELEEPRASEVEAWLAESPEARAVVASFGEIGLQVRLQADRDAAEGGADAIVNDVMARLDEPQAPESRSKVVPLRRQPSLGSYALAGLALAAAAALVVWKFAGPAGHPLATPSGLPSPSEPLTAMVETPDNDDREPGVSVDSIEFGAHAGTIFYVPTDKGTTTVVWLTDDDTGDER